MSIRIVRLGEPRAADEGLRLGTVRRPPRGVPKAEFASRDFYDVWLPELSPSEPLVKAALGAATPQDWKKFVQAFRKEMAQGPASRTLDVLAAFSHRSQFAVGCYCAEESRCHRSVLRTLFAERGAAIVE